MVDGEDYNLAFGSSEKIAQLQVPANCWVQWTVVAGSRTRQGDFYPTNDPDVFIPPVANNGDGDDEVEEVEEAKPRTGSALSEDEPTEPTADTEAEENNEVDTLLGETDEKQELLDAIAKQERRRRFRRPSRAIMR